MTAKSRAVERAERPVPAPMPTPAPVPTHLGQATAVEQSRAVAEVQAAVVVAQQRPRDITAAIREMRQSCARKSLAERAFFRYSRGGSTVSGESVHLARELARCFRNIQYGIHELRRNDAEAYSEMQAWAWDLEANTRNSNTFIVPHKRDRSADKGGQVLLTDMRDIYENNANAAARRLRAAILAILPPWFVEEAKDLCSQTLRADGAGKTLAQRIADAVQMYEGIGITMDQLEQKLGRKSGQWTEHDFAQLGVMFRSIQRGEVTKDEEFPPQRVTAAEIRGATAASAEQPAAGAGEDWPATAQPPDGGGQP